MKARKTSISHPVGVMAIGVALIVIVTNLPWVRGWMILLAAIVGFGFGARALFRERKAATVVKG